MSRADMPRELLIRVLAKWRHARSRSRGSDTGLDGRMARLEHELLMPKYQFHSPMDYSSESHPPAIASVALARADSLPLPPPECRPGYSPEDDEHYLRWGKSDHDLILSIIERHYGLRDGMEILDWGCSSGRVLRHFYDESRVRLWKLHGTDVQALLVEWMRRNFPPEIDVTTGSLLPHLPFRDASLDAIFGISVLTHTKYLWDAWLAEFRRILKPGGICIQTLQCEPAWTFYHQNRRVEWIRNALPAWVLEKPEMDEDYVLLGDGFISQTFWRESAVRKFMGRYMTVVEVLPPPQFHFQNWVVFQNA